MERWMHDEPRPQVPIARYLEITRDARLGVTMALTRSMPCCTSSGERLCGRGATLGYVVPEANGTWILMPVCDRCLDVLAVAYAASQPM